jgi:hypothetical protein
MGKVFGVSHDCPFVLYLERITGELTYPDDFFLVVEYNIDDPVFYGL